MKFEARCLHQPLQKALLPRPLLLLQVCTGVLFVSCSHQFCVKVQSFSVTLDTCSEAIQPSPREGKVHLQICGPEIRCLDAVHVLEDDSVTKIHTSCTILEVLWYLVQPYGMVNTAQKAYTILQQKLEATLKYFSVALNIKMHEDELNSVTTQGNEVIWTNRQQGESSGDKSRVLHVWHSKTCLQAFMKCQMLRDEMGRDAGPFLLSNCGAN